MVMTHNKEKGVTEVPGKHQRLHIPPESYHNSREPLAATNVLGLYGI